MKSINEIIAPASDNNFILFDIQGKIKLFFFLFNENVTIRSNNSR
jgi:hypothetical protein